MPAAWAIVISQDVVLTVSCLVFVFPEIMFGRINLSDSGLFLVGFICSVTLIEFSIARFTGTTKQEKP